LMNKMQAEDNHFKNYIDLLYEDRDRMHDIAPFLPDWLLGHISSESFLVECMEAFDLLDIDRSGGLSPDELLPVVVSLIGLDDASLSLERLNKFVSVFDADGNGVIQRDEFLEFVQFMEVMNFLASTTEGQQVEEAATIAAELDKCDALISALEQDVSNLPEVMSYLPRSMIDELSSNSFTTDCVAGFRDLDTSDNKVLEPAELFPFIIQLCEGHPMAVGPEECRQFAAIFDKDSNGVISLDEFSTLCKFIITMGYFKFTKEWREDTVYHSHDRIEMLLKLMQDHCDRLNEVLPLLPSALQEQLMSAEFAEAVMAHFDELDKDRSGSLEPKELVHVFVELTQANSLSITEEQVLRFVDIFDSENTGVISRSEFLNASRFVTIMDYLETEDGQAVQDYADISIGEKRVEEYLSMLEHDRNALPKVISLLPEAMFDYLVSDEFIEGCLEGFGELDADKNGTLEPAELFPVILEMSKAHPYSVDLAQCERFTAIFDMRGDGVIRIDEFIEFSRFFAIMSYMQSADGKRQCAEGLQVLEDSKKIEDLIQMLEQDRHDIRKVIPYLPEDLRAELLSEKFTVSCRDKFKELDVDASGSLEPSELYPILMDMTEAHHLALDLSQCERFTAIFDDAKSGYINLQEFVNFARFLLVMSFLQTEDGANILDLVNDNQMSTNAPSPTSQMPLSPQNMPPSPQIGHLNVDVEFYQQKSDKLGKENADQRRRLLEMEEAMRAMDERMELQECKLRHAGVDLNYS